MKLRFPIETVDQLDEARLGLIRRIESAFDDVELEDGTSISQLKLIDDYEVEEVIAAARQLDTYSHWREIKTDDIPTLCRDAAFLDVKGYKFHFPAAAIDALTIDVHGLPHLNAVSDRAWAFSWPMSMTTSESDWLQKRLQLFDKFQLELAAEFLFLLASGSSIPLSCGTAPPRSLAFWDPVDTGIDAMDAIESFWHTLLPTEAVIDLRQRMNARAAVHGWYSNGVHLGWYAGSAPERR